MRDIVFFPYHKLIPANALPIVFVVLLEHISDLEMLRLVWRKCWQPLIRLMCPKIALEFLKALKFPRGEIKKTLCAAIVFETSWPVTRFPLTHLGPLRHIRGILPVIKEDLKWFIVRREYFFRVLHKPRTLQAISPPSLIRCVISSDLLIFNIDAYICRLFWDFLNLDHRWLFRFSGNGWRWTSCCLPHRWLII